MCSVTFQFTLLHATVLTDSAFRDRSAQRVLSARWVRRDQPDATVSAFKGAQGLPGASVKGDRGERGPAGPDTSEALTEARAVIESCRTELASLKVAVQGLLDANKRGSEYVGWLLERVKTRAAGN